MVNQMQSPPAKSRSSKAKKLRQVGRKERGHRVVGEIFPCKICLRPFTNRTSAHLHAHTHLNCDELKKSSIFHAKCPHCQKVFFHRRHFTDHVNAHEGRKKHDCPVCKKKFTTKAHLTSHLFLHLSGEEQAEVKQGWRHICYFCSKRFKCSSLLSRHLSSHTKEKVGGSCPLCRKTFSSKQQMTRHRFQHLTEDEKTAQGSSRVCLFCHKKFLNNLTYRAHLVTHIPEKPFRCDQCGALFARNGDLKRHQRSHSSNPKLIKCGECDHAFTRKYYLTRHKKTVHRKLKDFACSRCHNKFGTKSSVVRHLNGVHLKIRHPCHHCGKTFIRKDKLGAHLKRCIPQNEVLLLPNNTPSSDDMSPKHSLDL